MKLAGYQGELLAIICSELANIQIIDSYSVQPIGIFEDVEKIFGFHLIFKIILIQPLPTCTVWASSTTIIIMKNY